MPRVLGGSWEGGRFLMGEVPLFPSKTVSAVCPHPPLPSQPAAPLSLLTRPLSGRRELGEVRGCGEVASRMLSVQGCYSKSRTRTAPRGVLCSEASPYCRALWRCVSFISSNPCTVITARIQP